MRSVFPWAVALCLPVFASLAAADTLRSLPDAAERSLVARNIPPEQVSAYVHEIGAAEPLLAFNADVPRNPASTIKLLTTFLGLEALGPTYTWKTEVYADAPPVGGVLEGDLYLKGYGDPFLVLERFWLLAREIRLQGVREIRGNLVIDNTYFQLASADSGDFDGRPFNTYNVVPDALLVNFQAINFLFRPDAESNRVEILADPMPANLEIHNRMQLVDGRCGGKQNRITFTVANPPGHDEVTFAGRFSRNCSQYRVTRTVMQAPAYAYGLFRALWEDSGGVLQGKLRVAAVPAGAKRLLTSDSLPLAEIIRLVNKHSNNVMARHILLTLGAERYGPPANVEKGGNAATEFLLRRGLEMPELEIANGAGLARDTRISVRSLGRLLLAADRSPYRAEYIASLALAGLDGTARRQFREEEFVGHMHLKTGTLNGVRAIAGYVEARSGRRFVVAMIQNAGGWGDEAQTALLRWVYRQ